MKTCCLNTKLNMECDLICAIKTNRKLILRKLWHFVAVCRLWAEIFEVQEQEGDVCWAPVSTDVVPVNITCIQDTPEIVFQITAYNRHVEKIFDVKLIQPGMCVITKLCHRSGTCMCVITKLCHRSGTCMSVITKLCHRSGTCMSVITRLCHQSGTCMSMITKLCHQSGTCMSVITKLHHQSDKCVCVCVCVRACVQACRRAGVRAWVRACVHACVWSQICRSPAK